MQAVPMIIAKEYAKHPVKDSMIRAAMALQQTIGR
jgi:hypothetical protein